MSGIAITHQQAALYLSERSRAATQTVAAAKSGMSRRTATRLEYSPGSYVVKSSRSRTYRTRIDPFASVWNQELVPKLTSEPRLMSPGRTHRNHRGFVVSG